MLLEGGSPIITPTTSNRRCTRSPMDIITTRFTFPAILKLHMYAMAGWRFLYTSTCAPPCYRTHYYSRFMAPNPIKWITSTPIHRASKVWTTESPIQIALRIQANWVPLSVSAHPHVMRDQSSKAPNSISEYYNMLSLLVPHHPPAMEEETLATAVLLMFTELLKRVYRERCTRWWWRRLTRQVQSPPTTTRDAAVQSREYLTHQHSTVVPAELCIIIS